MTHRPPSSPFDGDDASADNASAPDAGLLDRYWRGEATPRETARVHAWLLANPDRATRYDALQRGLRAGDGTSLPPHDAARWTAAVMQAIETSSRTTRVTDRATVPSLRVLPSARTRAWRLPVLGAIAAAALVMAIPAVRTAMRTAVLPELSHRAGPTRTYATASAQRLTVTLDDGSRVTLAPETQIQYHVDHNGIRTANVTGEAFFVVVPNANHPFVVHTSAVTTRVLGTAFNVRHYPTDATTQVAVVSGRVATGGYGAPAVLAAGMVARVTDSSVTVSSTDDPARVATWTQGRLVFSNVRVSDMLATLGRWYGYEFHLPDTTLSAYHVSVAFRIDQPTEMMNTVKAMLGVSMTFEGHVVTLQATHKRVRATQSELRRAPLDNSTLEVGK